MEDIVYITTIIKIKKNKINNKIDFSNSIIYNQKILQIEKKRNIKRRNVLMTS